MPNKKALTGLKINDADKGTVTAVFATFNVVDHDGDVTLPGAFEDGAEVRISAWNHASWSGAMPVGKGTIHQTDTEAILDGQFFLNTTAGRETFEVVKELGDLGEWSYGFDVEKNSFGKFEDRDVQFLEKLKTHEVSPVLLGAGIGTRTLATKGKQLSSDLGRRLRDVARERFAGDDTYVWLEDFDPDESWAVFTVEADDTSRHVRVDFTRDDTGAVTLSSDEADVERTTAYTPKDRGSKFVDEADHALACMEGLVARSKSLADLRAKEGRVLSATNRERLKALTASLAEATTAIGELLAETDPNKHADALVREIARYERLRSSH